MTIPDPARSDVPQPPSGGEWTCASAISPRKDALIEFRSKDTPRIHRGRFTGSGYVEIEGHVEYPPRTVREWRYLA